MCPGCKINTVCMFLTLVLVLFFFFHIRTQILCTQVAEKHMGHKKGIKVVSFLQSFPFRLQCEHGGTSAPPSPFISFCGVKYLSDMQNDSQTVWRCTHTEGKFGVPCVTHWFPSGMRSSMQPAHFRG